MKSFIRIIAILLMLILMVLIVPSGTIVAFAEIVEIPLEADAGLVPQESGYLDEWNYEDPSISVKIESGRIYDTNYKVAYIKLANASQIRTTMARNYHSPSTISGVTMAKRVNAVLAINGDFFSSRNGEGYVARQGKVYRTACRNEYYDILIIDDQGDLHILQKPNDKDIAAFEGTPINGFTFGPGLIVDGEVQLDLGNGHYGGNKQAQRMCIGQTGPLEYICICSEGPEDPGSKGMTIDQFVELVASFEGIENAYNLDGGSSTHMVFHGEKINSPDNPKRRPLCDMIYFASAYQPDAAEETAAE